MERLVLEGCAAHGLPRPQVNVWIDIHEVDFFWPDAGLVLEFDGEAVHRTRRAFHRDRARDRALAAQGIHVVRATLRERAGCAGREVATILAVRLRR